MFTSPHFRAHDPRSNDNYHLTPERKRTPKMIRYFVLFLNSECPTNRAPVCTKDPLSRRDTKFSQTTFKSDAVATGLLGSGDGANPIAASGSSIGFTTACEDEAAE